VEQAAVANRADDAHARSDDACPPAPGAALAARAAPLLEERVVQAFVALVMAALVGLGVWLDPDAGGTGTHEQLGLPPCGLLISTGVPCPTCGVTTSFALAAHGRFAEAFVNQPFGLITFIVAAGALAALVAALALGRSLAGVVTPWRIGTGSLVLVVLATLSWLYKWQTM
jgi:hypothetical protein